MSERGRWLQAGGHFSWVPNEPLLHADSLNIFHAEFGDPDAPLLLMVHGFPTSSIDWCDVAGELSVTHRVCVLDMPGFGFSDKPVGESYTLRRDSELLGFYVEQILGATTGAIVAHDRGDSVALGFAIRCAAGEFPFELTNLVLSNGNIFLPLSNLTDYRSPRWRTPLPTTTEWRSCTAPFSIWWSVPSTRLSGWTAWPRCQSRPR